MYYGFGDFACCLKVKTFRSLSTYEKEEEEHNIKIAAFEQRQGLFKGLRVFKTIRDLIN